MWIIVTFKISNLIKKHINIINNKKTPTLYKHCSINFQLTDINILMHLN